MAAIVALAVFSAVAVTCRGIVAIARVVGLVDGIAYVVMVFGVIDVACV